MCDKRTETLNGILTVAVATLLFLLLAGSAWALTASDCATCHGADIVEGHHDTIDPNSDFNQGRCNQCHVGITTSGDCSNCHTFTLQSNSHHIAQDDVPIDCSLCHTGGTDIQICLNCHDGKVQTRHHEVAAAGVNCAACHPAMLQQPACTDCHGITRERHHAVADTANVACITCHTSMTVLPSCQGCHLPGSERISHHDAATINGSPCSDCHAGSAQTGNCADCHQGTNLPDHHTLPAYSSSNCGGCHTSAAIDQSSCRWCHYYNPDVNDKHHSDPTYLWVTYQLGCNTCHVFSGSTIPSGLKTDCISCHETKLGVFDTQTRHHAKYPAVTGNCTACHQAGTITGSVCDACHGTPGIAIAPRADAKTHHATPQATAGSCILCHAVTPVSETNCASCHAAKAPITDTHHMTLPAQLNQCATCHAGIAPTSLACANCHINGAAIPIAERHHASPTGQTGTCSSCHSQATPAEIPCSACHSGGRHHLEPQAAAGDCAYCHGTTQLAGGSCATCHTAPIPEIHHGDPLTDVSGNCAVCHQSVSDPSVCANCHTSSPHHATTWSQAGDCAHCHSVPATAADRPAQAACRECHGTTMHDKGGPIKNYGICAACHNTIPFHPAPTSIPGYTGYGAGKKKFNMFWSKYAREEGPGERIYPNGENMNDKGGDKIKAQQLSFSTKQISSNGRTYTVPYFTGMASGNLALQKTATASRAESGYAPSLAVDGNTATRWWAKSTSAQALTVDLGTSKSINKVTIRWYSYYAKAYQVQTSTDNRSWTTVFSTSYGVGGTEVRTFTTRTARYVRINCQTASSSNGYSINELEVYAP